MSFETTVVPYVRALSAPAAEPVLLAEAKLWCRVDAADEDALFTLLIRGCRERAEDITGRAFVRRQLELRLDRFPTGSGAMGQVIELPFPPLYSVDYVDYVDPDGALQRLTGSPSNWREDTGSTPGRIQPLAGASWPAIEEVASAVRVGFTCGYAPGTGSPTDYAENLPAELKLWMQARIATYYKHREQLDLNNVAALPRDFVDGLLDGLKVNKGFA